MQPLLLWKAVSITQTLCVCVCVCSVRYPAYNAHAPYCHLWPVALFYNTSPLYIMKGTIFEKKGIEHKMCVLIFSTNLYETFLIIKIT